MSFFYLLLGGLATYRLALLISKEDGPAQLLLKLRKCPPQHSTVRDLLECEWCVSVWIAAVVATYLWWLGIVPGREWPLHWLAYSAIAVICNQQWSKGR